jgi:hypothetical protein
MFNNLPIPEIAAIDRTKLDSIVDRILAVKQREPEANTSALEAEIDRHVYALYGLTKEEIALVEGSQAK